MGLDLSVLRSTNIKRCADAFGPLEEWTETDWGCALSGEVGELCNLLKKRRRGEPIDVNEVKKEIADVLIYLDLLSARIGIDLSQAVVQKFNEVSDRRGSKIKLAV